MILVAIIIYNKDEEQKKMQKKNRGVKFCVLYLSETHFRSVSPVKTGIILFFAFTFHTCPHGIKT